ncbi:hypothetical protein KIN20_004756 [Parelaphostrongylus tenuis]|uniref:Uncharacterized protein n=1 Tax=Parelaphostrongylus tenuis TaxID=148309 RepID=A0AAD5QFF2_PARTN|nr:hypothetical protein KIN20_004756 [Parelaphostrongylus tenuis]
MQQRHLTTTHCQVCGRISQYRLLADEPSHHSPHRLVMTTSAARVSGAKIL